MDAFPDDKSATEKKASKVSNFSPGPKITLADVQDKLFSILDRISPDKLEQDLKTAIQQQLNSRLEEILSLINPKSSNLRRRNYG